MFAAFVQKRHPHLTYEQCVKVSSAVESQFDVLPRWNGDYDMQVIGRSADEWAQTLFGDREKVIPVDSGTAIADLTNFLGYSIKPRDGVEYCRVTWMPGSTKSIVEFQQRGTDEKYRITIEAVKGKRQ